MINPEITDVGPDDFLVWDDCFCFPNLLVRVTRAYQVTLGYTDLKGKQRTLQLQGPMAERSEEHTSELQSRLHLVCRLLLEKKKKRRSSRDHTPYYVRTCTERRNTRC